MKLFFSNKVCVAKEIALSIAQFNLIFQMLRCMMGFILFIVILQSLRLLRYERLFLLFGRIYSRAHRELKMLAVSPTFQESFIKYLNLYLEWQLVVDWFDNVVVLPCNELFFLNSKFQISETIV